MSYAPLKRALDLLFGGLFALLCLPLWGAIALVLLVVEGRPVLFRQTRAGQHGVPFAMLKFRTMRAGAPPPLPDRPVGRPPDDPRVTPFGRLLRRTGLDETPQLLNIVRGEMSLIGPRPLPVEDLAHQGWQRVTDPTERARREEWAVRRRQVRPGLAGLWQISPNPVEDFENWITCDLAYVDEQSLGLDLRIVLRLPWSLLCGRRS
jgi:lipopolysaccharide/colanic/teichoic acid biosynthesis glycosyltransferase